jgi:replication-associated recombination protein RarA
VAVVAQIFLEMVPQMVVALEDLVVVHHIGTLTERSLEAQEQLVKVIMGDQRLVLEVLDQVAEVVEQELLEVDHLEEMEGLEETD